MWLHDDMPPLPPGRVNGSAAAWSMCPASCWVDGCTRRLTWSLDDVIAPTNLACCPSTPMRLGRMQSNRPMWERDRPTETERPTEWNRQFEAGRMHCSAWGAWCPPEDHQVNQPNQRPTPRPPAWEPAPASCSWVWWIDATNQHKDGRCLLGRGICCPPKDQQMNQPHNEPAIQGELDPYQTRPIKK